MILKFTKNTPVSFSTLSGPVHLIPTPPPIFDIFLNPQKNANFFPKPSEKCSDTHISP